MMLKTKKNRIVKGNQKGAVLILIALLLVLFIGIVALAIDVYHLYVARNELQNAADAGALAGALYLYLDDGTAVNPGANSIASNAAIQNTSEKVPVELIFDANLNTGDVQRGHWSFSARQFTRNSSLDAIDLPNISTADLDNPDPNINKGFINAVKVRVRRQDTPVASFFARIFGFQDFGIIAEAVAYLGFAGSLPPGAIDVPIAICEDYIIDGNEYSCNLGRMISESEETGGWTNFDQSDGCGDAGVSDETGIGGLLCNGGNPKKLIFGQKVGTNNGMTVLLSKFYDRCWTDASGNPPTTPMNVTLPVVSCDGGNFEASCVERVIGAVNVDIVWINTNNADENFKNVGKNKENPPTYMDAPGYEPFSCSYSTSEEAENCWNNFTTHFNLVDINEDPAPYLTQTIYFLPSCEKQGPTGITGGKNYGVLAERPVLVNRPHEFWN